MTAINSNTMGRAIVNPPKQQYSKSYFWHPMEWIFGVVVLIILIICAMFIVKIERNDNPLATTHHIHDYYDLSNTVRNNCQTDLRFLCPKSYLNHPPSYDCLAMKMGPSLSVTLLNRPALENDLGSGTYPKNEKYVQGGRNKDCDLRIRIFDLLLSNITMSKLFFDTVDNESSLSDTYNQNNNNKYNNSNDNDALTFRLNSSQYRLDLRQQPIQEDTIQTVVCFYLYALVKLFDITEKLMIGMSHEEQRVYGYNNNQQFRMLQIFIPWLLQMFEIKTMTTTTTTTTESYIVPNIFTHNQVCGLMNWTIQFLMDLTTTTSNKTGYFELFDQIVLDQDSTRIKKFHQEYLSLFVANITSTICTTNATSMNNNNNNTAYNYEDHPTYFGFVLSKNSIDSQYIMREHIRYLSKEQSECLWAFTDANQLISSECSDNTMPFVEPTIDKLYMIDATQGVNGFIGFFCWVSNIFGVVLILLLPKVCTKNLKDNKRRFLMQFQDPVLRKSLERRYNISLASQEERDAFLSQVENKVKDTDERLAMQHQTNKLLKYLRIWIIVVQPFIIILGMYVVGLSWFPEQWHIAILPLLVIAIGCVGLCTFTYAIPYLHEQYFFTTKRNHTNNDGKTQVFRDKDCEEVTQSENNSKAKNLSDSLAEINQT